MFAELKELFSIEIEIPLEKYLPENIYNFSINLDLLIGLKGEEGGNYFSTTVTTLNDLNRNKLTCFDEFIKGLLVVEKYDFKLIKNKISSFISTYSGNNWEAIAKELSKKIYWEFENYQPLL